MEMAKEEVVKEEVRPGTKTRGSGEDDDEGEGNFTALASAPSVLSRKGWEGCMLDIINK